MPKKYMEQDQMSGLAPQKRSNLWLIATIVLAALLIAGGVVFAWQNKTNSQVKTDLQNQINTLRNQINQPSNNQTTTNPQAIANQLVKDYLESKLTAADPFEKILAYQINKVTLGADEETCFRLEANFDVKPKQNTPTSGTIVSGWQTQGNIGADGWIRNADLGFNATKQTNGSYILGQGYTGAGSTSCKDSVDVTANWKTYTNTKYGFEIKYPNNLKILSEGMGDYHQEKEICSIVYEIKFRDSSKPKRVWEAGQKPEESTVDLRVARADCPSIFDEKAYSVKYPFPQSVLKIANDLLNFGFSKNRIYGQAFGVGVSWDESGKPLYSCENITLVKMDSNFAVVKESKCSTGPIYPETDAYILPPSGDFIFNLYDAASDYQQDGSFDQVLSTFKFTK